MCAYIDTHESLCGKVIFCAGKPAKALFMNSLLINMRSVGSFFCFGLDLAAVALGVPLDSLIFLLHAKKLWPLNLVLYL